MSKRELRADINLIKFYASERHSKIKFTISKKLYHSMLQCMENELKRSEGCERCNVKGCATCSNLAKYSDDAFCKSCEIKGVLTKYVSNNYCFDCGKQLDAKTV